MMQRIDKSISHLAHQCDELFVGRRQVHLSAKWLPIAGWAIAFTAVLLAAPVTAQEAAGGQQDDIEEIKKRVEELRAHTADIKDVQVKLKEAQDQIVGLTSSGDSLLGNPRYLLLKGQVEDLSARLASSTQSAAETQATLRTMTEHLAQMSTSVARDAETKRRAVELQTEVKKAKEEQLREIVGQFLGHVVAWRDLGAQLNAISSTAAGVLLFPPETQAGAAQIWSNIGKAAGLISGLAGAVVALNDPRIGTPIAGTGLTVAMLLQMIVPESTTSQVIENVARNIAFSDEIRSFAKLVAPFATKTAELQEAVARSRDNRNSGWLPERPLLEKYYALTALRRDIMVIVRQMRAQAEDLQSNASITPTGRKTIESLLVTYQSALAAWEASEVIYKSVYETILQASDTK